MSDTVKLRYSSSKNISFHGELDLNISVEDWAEMSESEQNRAIDDVVYEIIDVSVVGE